MSKKKWIAVVMLCVSLAVIIALPAFASNNAQIKIPRDFFVKFAKTIKYYNGNNDSKVAFKIGNIQVPVSEVEKKKELLEQAGNGNVTYDEVVKSIARNKILLEEAKKRGIEITFEQAKKRSLQEKDEIYKNADKDQIAAVEEYIKALGISSDEYWNDYNAKEYQIYMTVNALYEDIIKEAEQGGKIEKFPSKTGETKEIQKKFVEDYIENFLNNTKIEVVDSDLKGKLKEIK
ncbi:hypothetical protein [Mahella sp.]|uniref:hypothetical protein n=1 Tax=Mahella sp. TaxID=2798721 RepID=UPI0025C43427|nr:hypothetical protein [Mahella sp.]MBZ4666174.1 hypothetical protein [Mahella sp.]